MRHSLKRLLRFAAITAIGLAGSAFAGSAQAAPAPMHCESGLTLLTVLHGKIDNFAAGADSPAPSPSNALKATYPQLVAQAANNIFDSTSTDYLFGDTLLLSALPTGATIVLARVSTRLKPNGSTGSSSANNDTISFLSGTTASSRFGFAIKDLVPNSTNPKTWGNNNTSQAGGVDFVFMIASTVNQSPASPPYMTGSTGFLATLAASKSLDVLMQDDTSIDYLQLDVCYRAPAPKYDLVASKKRDGSVYTLNVHNAGQPIMPTGKVDVVEVVPAGLIIDGASGTSWQCPGVIFPVVGPDAFTCTYQIPAGGIAANANLPPIVLKTEGKAECPNCMRVKLYFKSVADGVKPVEEDDMKNNASCTM